MRRVVSVFLPTWATDRWRRMQGSAAPSTSLPVACVGRDGNRRVITSVDLAAHHLGLRIGMTVAKAQIIVPDVLLLDAAPKEDRDALEKLALWALQRYSPMAAADLPDGLVIDSTGADHLFGGETEMVQHMLKRLADYGITARIAIADSWGAAHPLARFQPQAATIIPPGESGKAISALPLAALRLPASMVQSLQTLGFSTIGEVAAQPRAPLALRFGVELGRRLDQAFGRMAEPIEPVRPNDLTEIERDYAEPISNPETIARYTRIMAEQLCAALEGKQQGVRRADLLFRLVDNRLQAIRVSMAQPMRNAKQLAKLLCEKIETVDPGFGIERMVLVATQAERLLPRQQVSALGEEAERDVTELIDTLSNRIGAERVYRFAPVVSDFPERSVQKIPAAAPDIDESWPDHWPRPPRLLLRPEPIQTVALLPDHPPASFIWAGARRRVRAADGPERVFGEWWAARGEGQAVRDYFKVEDENGERYWIFRAGDGEDPTTGSQQWFLHGVFA